MKGLGPASEEPSCWKVAYSGVTAEWKGNLPERQELQLDLDFALTSSDFGQAIILDKASTLSYKIMESDHLGQPFYS